MMDYDDYHHHHHHQITCIGYAFLIPNLAAEWFAFLFRIKKVSRSNLCLESGYPTGLQENGGSCTMRSFIICTHPQISLGRSNQGEWGVQGMWLAWKRKVYRVLVGKSEGKRPLGRPRHSREDGIRMGLREIGRRGV
jgi:hypothetical protein